MSDLARKYDIDGPRGNMVVKEFLVENEIDFSKFHNPLLKSDKIRRSSLKMPGIQSITIVEYLKISNYFNKQLFFFCLAFE